jgi:hypothetical protein
MEEIRTFYVRLNAVYPELGGYITYVFENLDFKNYELKYFMCERFPNWDHPDLQEGDVGYVNLRYAEAGVSKWYDGEKLNVYKNTYMVFLKFIKEPTKVNNEFVVD